jgi:aminopeptidase-like protein
MGAIATAIDLQTADIGQQLYSFVSELYPICRSITGNGLRETLRRIGEKIPIDIHEVPTGTQVFDWVVPKEWNIRDAYIANSRGERVIDFRRSNLHVVNYSIPVRAKLSLSDLKNHLHSLPDHPDWIPYRTSYYRETWGFCISQRQLDSLPDDEYEVVIDSSLDEGSLTYAEYLLPGETTDEILISTHCCHPSLCNDNLSGMAVAVFLAKALASMPRRYSYRFLFIPGTIGSITWLSRNEHVVPRIKHGLVLACVGDPGSFSYKKTRRGDAEIDRAVAHLLNHSREPYSITAFSPYGYDERQYCSPGFNLPVGCLNRTPHGKFAEYHTSADNLDFISPEALEASLQRCLELFRILEGNRIYRNLNPKCEPQLGRRGLYRHLGGYADADLRELAMLWVLNLSDGEHSLLDIAERSDLRFDMIQQACSDLQQHGLLAFEGDRRVDE